MTPEDKETWLRDYGYGKGHGDADGSIHLSWTPKFGRITYTAHGGDMEDALILLFSKVEQALCDLTLKISYGKKLGYNEDR